MTNHPNTEDTPTPKRYVRVPIAGWILVEIDAEMPPARWQLRLSNGDLIADEYEWMDGGTNPDKIDWDPVEDYIDEGIACEAWWMVPTRVAHADLPAAAAEASDD